MLHQSYLRVLAIWRYNQLNLSLDRGFNQIKTIALWEVINQFQIIPKFFFFYWTFLIWNSIFFRSSDLEDISHANVKLTLDCEHAVTLSDMILTRYSCKMKIKLICLIPAILKLLWRGICHCNGLYKMLCSLHENVERSLVVFTLQQNN